VSADLTERVALAWAAHLRTKRNHRQARRSSFDAAWNAALAAVAVAPGLEEALRAHAEVGDYFTAEAGWVNYGCLCGRVFGQESEYPTHLADVVRAWLRGQS